MPCVNVHAAVPVQAPVHPLNTDPACGAAFSVTTVLVASEALQVPGQLMPLPVTVPDPVPVSVTFTGKEVGMKSAPTDAAAFIVTVQPPVPEQAPLHPLNVDPAFADGVSVTVAD